MASAFCTAGKKALLDAKAGDTWVMALYTSSATLDATTAAYTATNEVSGGGYSAPGATLTVAGTGSGSGTAWIDFDDVTWSTATFTARYALIYNSSDSNRAYAVIDFGTDKTGQGGDFTFVFPTADASNAIIRI